MTHEDQILLALLIGMVPFMLMIVGQIILLLLEYWQDFYER